MGQGSPHISQWINQKTQKHFVQYGISCLQCQQGCQANQSCIALSLQTRSIDIVYSITSNACFHILHIVPVNDWIILWLIL